MTKDILKFPKSARWFLNSFCLPRGRVVSVVPIGRLVVTPARRCVSGRGGLVVVRLDRNFVGGGRHDGGMRMGGSHL